MLRGHGASYGVNLLANADAEAGVASSTGAAVPIPGWSVTGPMTVVSYGASGGFPTADAGPYDLTTPSLSTGGKQFFAGGNDSSSSAVQVFDVSSSAEDIDAGNVVCDISGWLGGYADQQDNATLTVSFLSASAAELSNASIGPVGPGDRDNITDLIYRERLAVPVVPGTRSVVVTLLLQRVGGGAFNDAYADNLSVVLRGPVVVTSTDNSGGGSFRDALTKGTMITFDPTVFAVSKGAQTITLQSPLPFLHGAEKIIGPGANLLTIRRADGSGVPAFGILRSLVLSTDTPPSVAISGVTLANAQADTDGQGNAIHAANVNLTIENCAIVDNSTGFEGAVSIANSIAQLDGCTIARNTADSGAAIQQYRGGAITLTNCTISGNTNTGNAAGVIASTIDQPGENSAIKVIASTITGNTGAFTQRSGGGSSASVSLENTIIADNGPSQFNSGGGSVQYLSNGFNLSTNNDSLILNQPSDQNITNPMLGPLQYNGGPTPTHALLPGSPAIDKGNTSLTVDQRGAPRPVDDPKSTNGTGNNSDIGAFEFGAAVPAPMPRSSGQLLNISTRMQVLTGDNVLIAGFIIAGTDQKQVLLRGLGPSLPIAGALSDTVLELHSSSSTILTNDNWKDTNPDQISATGIPPSDDRESAILATLQGNNSAYTAILRGQGGSTGIGLVEVYDVAQNAKSNLANISTRGFVSRGDNVMIGGFIVANGALKVLARAIGPSLRVSDALADPYLELHDQDGNLVQANDNWRTDQATEIQATTIPPNNELESALVRTVAPGNYTVVVRSANNTTGVALVEVYALQ